MMKIVTILGIALVGTLSASFGKKSNLQVHRVMKDLGSALEDVFPYFYDKKKFENPKSKKFIQLKLKNISDELKQAHPHFELESPVYQVSLQTIQDQVDEVMESYEKGHYNYARKQGQSIPSICMSCHALDNDKRTIFKEASPDSYITGFAYAEFSLATRSYENAEKYYDKYLTSRTFEKSNEYTRRALRGQLNLHIQKNYGVDRTRRLFEKYKKLPAIHAFEKQKMGDWLIALKEVKKDPLLTKQKLNFKQVEALYQKYLKPNEKDDFTIISSEEEVIFLHLHKQFKKYLAFEKNADKVVKVLYWLAMLERGLHYEFISPLANLYLKECMNMQPYGPVGRSCWVEYQKYIRKTVNTSVKKAFQPDAYFIQKLKSRFPKLRLERNEALDRIERK